MLSAILKSDIAVNMSVEIIRAFVNMRKFIASNSNMFERFKSWSGKTINKEQILDSLRIEIIEKNELCWDNLVETDVTYWEKKFDRTMQKARFRFTATF